jgi:hypothetical protein
MKKQHIQKDNNDRDSKKNTIIHHLWLIEKKLYKLDLKNHYPVIT